MDRPYCYNTIKRYAYDYNYSITPKGNLCEQLARECEDALVARANHCATIIPSRTILLNWHYTSQPLYYTYTKITTADGCLCDLLVCERERALDLLLYFHFTTTTLLHY